MPIDTDVAIVGYGPVGSALAILLAQLGDAAASPPIEGSADV